MANVNAQRCSNLFQRPLFDFVLDITETAIPKDTEEKKDAEDSKVVVLPEAEQVDPAAALFLVEFAADIADRAKKLGKGGMPRWTKTLKLIVKHNPTATVGIFAAAIGSVPREITVKTNSRRHGVLLASEEHSKPGDVQKHWLQDRLLASRGSGVVRRVVKDALYSHVASLYKKAKKSGIKEDAAAAKNALEELVIKLVELMPQAQQHWKVSIWSSYCELWKLLCSDPNMQSALLDKKWSVLGALLKLYIGHIPQTQTRQPQQQQQPQPGDPEEDASSEQVGDQQPSAPVNPV